MNLLHIILHNTCEWEGECCGETILEFSAVAYNGALAQHLSFRCWVDKVEKMTPDHLADIGKDQSRLAQVVRRGMRRRALQAVSPQYSPSR